MDCLVSSAKKFWYSSPFPTSLHFLTMLVIQASMFQPVEENVYLGLLRAHDYVRQNIQ